MSDMDPWWEAMLDAMFEGVYFVDRDRRVVLWNRAAERITGHRAEQLLNLRCAEAALCHIDGSGSSMCEMGCPLTRVMSDKSTVETDAWLLHRDGHRLPVHIRTQAVLGRDGEVVGAVELFENASLRLEEQPGAVSPAAVLSDPLTGTALERVLFSAIQSRLRQTAHEGLPFGAALVAIDRAAWARAVYGDGAALELVRMVARTMISNVSPSDIVSRRDEDSFALVLSAGELDEVFRLADRLRMLVEKSIVSLGGETLRTTVSIGATVSEVNDTVETLMARVHSLTEHSRNQGGGCVTVSQAPAVSRPPLVD